MSCDLMLIAYDGSDHARRAITYAGRYLAADRAVVLTAWQPALLRAARMAGFSGMMQPEWVPDEDLDDASRAAAVNICAEGAELAKHAGINAEARTAETTGLIWETIVAEADRMDADIIVAGTRGATGLRALLRSSVADAVLKHCHRPVLLVPPCDRLAPKPTASH